MPKTSKKTSSKLVSAKPKGRAGKPVVAVISADFNKAIVGPMTDAALITVKALGCDIGPVISVPGCIEIPLILDAVLQRREVDAVAVLGYIEKGETLHGEVMGHVVYAAMTDLSLMYGKPVGLGIIGPGATLDQAKKRNVAYGKAAVEAAVKSLGCLEQAQG